MRLYSLSYPNLGSENGDKVVEWHPSEATAKKRRTELKKSRGKDFEGAIDPVDVPTDKTGLMAFLNANAGVKL